MKVGVYEAKSKFSEIIERVQAGEEIEITKNGKPAARIVGIQQKKKSLIGLCKDKFEVPDDFNEPLDDEMIDLLTGDKDTDFFPDENSN